MPTDLVQREVGHELVLYRLDLDQSVRNFCSFLAAVCVSFSKLPKCRYLKFFALLAEQECDNFTLPHGGHVTICSRHAYVGAIPKQWKILLRLFYFKVSVNNKPHNKQIARHLVMTFKSLKSSAEWHQISDCCAHGGKGVKQTSLLVAWTVIIDSYIMTVPTTFRRTTEKQHFCLSQSF